MMKITYNISVIYDNDNTYNVLIGHVIISNYILTTYNIIYNHVKNDVLKQVSDTIKYNPHMIKYKCRFAYLNAITTNAKTNNILVLNTKLLNFDIDVTKPFKLSQLVENVI